MFFGSSVTGFVLYTYDKIHAEVHKKIQDKLNTSLKSQVAKIFELKDFAEALVY